MSGPGQSVQEPINWPALIRAGQGRLGLSPQQFWAMTPAELMIRLGHGSKSGAQPMGRARLADLLRSFPDAPEGELGRAGHSERTET